MGGPAAAHAAVPLRPAETITTVSNCQAPEIFGVLQLWRLCQATPLASPTVSVKRRRTRDPPRLPTFATDLPPPALDPFGAFRDCEFNAVEKANKTLSQHQTR